MRLFSVVTMIVAATRALSAQGSRDEELADTRPETWAMQYFASVTLPGGFGPADELGPGEASLAFNVGEIPHLSEEERRVGFNGTKVEDLNHAPIVVHPELTLGLPGGWSASVAYVPPVRAFDLRTDLYAISVQRSFGGRGPWQFGLRGFAQYAKVRGTFTCPQEAVDAGDDPVGNAYGCGAISHDSVRMRVAGLEVSVAYRFDRWHGLTPFAMVSWQDMNMDFEVDALRFGFRDHRYLKAETRSWIYSAGMRLPINEKWRFALSVLHAPIDVLRPGWTAPRSEPATSLGAQLVYFLGSDS